MENYVKATFGFVSTYLLFMLGRMGLCITITFDCNGN